nr:putative transposase, Ptta/En/Spm, plant [Tanacetum cinerariifolium]
MQTQTSNTLHNAIMKARGKDRPPMLALGNYVQWKYRIKRYIDTKPNHELIHYCLKNPPNKLTWADKTVPVSEGSPDTTTNQELKTVLYHKLYDILKQHQNEVNEIRAERIARNANPLALVAQQQPVYHPQNHPTHYTQNSSTRSQQAAIKNRGKAIVNSPTPIYDQEPSMVAEDDEMSKEKDIVDWRNDTDDESDDQELEAHYMYMAKLQEVTPDAADNSGPIFNIEPMQKNDDDNDLANERELHASLTEKLKCEIDDSKNHNKFLETSNKVLVEKLKGEIEDFKNKNKSLESSNNRFKEANNKQSETNKLLYDDFKKLKAKLERRNDVEYASKVEIDCAKARGDLISYKMESQKELNKVIALENKVKVLDNIVYKTGQSVQTMNMLNSKCQTSFTKLEFLKKAQRVNPRLYDIGCYNDNLALMLAPESDEVIRLEKESRSKLSDLIRPFDYEKLNNLYDLFVLQREKSSEQRYFSERSRLSNTPVNNGNSKKRINAGLEQFYVCLNEEMVADLRYFNSLELEVDSLRSQLETQKTQFLNEIDRLSREYYYIDHMNAILGVYTKLDEVTNLQCDYRELLQKCECLEKELSKSNIMSKTFESIQKHAINLELELQQCKEKMKNDKSFKVNQSKEFCKEHEKKFEIQDLKAQLQDKGIAISELKKLIEKLKGKSVDTKFEKSPVIRQLNAFKSQRQSILGKPTIFLDSLKRKEFSKSKSVTKNNVSNDFSKPVTAQILPPNKKSNLKNTNVLALGMYKLYTKPTQTRTSQLPNDSGKTNKRVSFSIELVEIILFIVDSGCSKHMTGNLKLLINFVKKFLGTVKFGNDQISPILGYGDLVQGAVTIKRVYYVEGLNHNLFFVGQLCDADLEVAFRKSTCYIRDLKGNDLIIGSRVADLYSITLQYTTSPNLICLMAKVTSSQAWLWHRRLSHLNFDTINLLSKNDIVRYFDVDLTVRKLVMNRLGQLLRNFRRKLRQTYILPNQNTLSKVNEVPTKYSAILKAEEWVNFVKYMATKEYKVKSAAAKMARSKSVYQHTIGRDRKKQTEPNEEPACGTLWLKGRVNKDREYPDDENRLVGDKLKETEDKIKKRTLKVDHGTDAMTVVLGKEKRGYARGVGSGVTYK